MIKVAINGFGRIGRAVFKSLLNRLGVKIIAINDLTDTTTLAHLLKYDSCYGQYQANIIARPNSLVVNGQSFTVLAEKDPTLLPWKNLGVDLVIESTGRFTDKEKASAHLKAGAKKVILSAPAKGFGVKTFVLGVNAHQIKKSDQVISMASCTTNCLAPVTEVIRRRFGIKKALMTTIHSYTADQNLVDGPHKDLRRARAAALSQVPTTTGAAIAAAETIPQIKGKFDGLAVRVPTPVGSLCDTVYLLSKPTTVEEVNAELKKAARSADLKGILVTTNDPVVSVDIVGNPASAIVDLSLTKIVGGDLLKIVSWYDNEWGYANRLADLTQFIGRRNLI